MSILPTEPRELDADEIEALDARARALPPLVVPTDLMARTRAAMAAELESVVGPSEPSEEMAAAQPRATAEVVHLRVSRSRWPLGAVAALAAAAAMFVVIPDRTAPAPVDRLVERGAGERLPDVSLKVARKTGTDTRRHEPGSAVPVGTDLYFRVGVDQAAEVVLVRVDAKGARVVHAQGADAGESDLALDGAPLAWAVEPGEGDAVFALLASGTAIDHSGVEIALGSTDEPADPAAVCQAALALGTRCDATAVKVKP